MTFTVLVTRPAHQSQALVDGIRACGWEAVSVPLFEIRPVADAEGASGRLRDARDADWWLFTSRNAVEQARALCGDSIEGWPRAAAIGAATADALRAAGHAAEAVPEVDHTSEALLALPAFNSVENQRIVIVTGEGGRETLELNLRERGARVESLPVYRREPTRPEPAELGRALLAADALLLSSGAGVERILELVPGAQRSRLLELPLVVPSERVADLAREAGFKGIVEVASPMTDKGLVHALGRAEAALRAQPEASGAGAAASADDKLAAPARAPAKARPAATESERQPAPQRGGRGGLLLAWFILIILLAVIGAGAWGAWQFWQHSESERSRAVTEATAARQAITELERRVERLARDRDDIQQTARRNNAEIGLLRERQDETADAIADLSDSVSGGRTDLQLAAVEQLLVHANERLQVVRDVDSADRALELADRRLARLAEPRLFPIREAIAEERSRLAEVPRADATALSLTLSTLIARADRLQLSERVPDRHEPEPAAGRAEGAEPATGLRRVLEATRRALGSVFLLRRADSQVKPLLAPEQAALVRTVLMLRLESARAALLARDGTAFREALDAADEWLEAQFDLDDQAVEGARREIARMRRSDLSPALPDISTSLGLIRGLLDAPRDPS